MEQNKKNDNVIDDSKIVFEPLEKRNRKSAELGKVIDNTKNVYN